ncbi:MAG TPA: diacylglycerol kinase family protein [Gaiellaceae bacterium]
MRGVLFVNPNSGADSPSVDDLATVAGDRGISVHVLSDGEDLVELARSAEADVLGMAGGDGSLGAVAQVAIERDLPFVCVPWGTRNHFAADAGLPTDEPLHAVAAFHGTERRVDVGRFEDRIFLNNVSLGVYGRLVHRRERRRRRDEAFARLRALATSAWTDLRWTRRFRVDGRPIRASVVLVANNEYVDALTARGARERLDGGSLALYAARGIRRLHWTERTALRFRIESGHPMHAAVDGEPALLASPLELRVDPGALRLLVPPAPDVEVGAASGVDG